MGFVPSSTGWNRVLLDFTGLKWVLLNVLSCKWVLVLGGFKVQPYFQWSFMGFLLSYTGLNLIVLGFTGLKWILSDVLSWKWVFFTTELIFCTIHLEELDFSWRKTVKSYRVSVLVTELFFFGFDFLLGRFVPPMRFSLGPFPRPRRVPRVPKNLVETR